jgi:hypothetical protein
MKCVELCFHERDGRAAEMAVRGLSEAGLVVLRRPVDDAHAPAPSTAAEARVLLHSTAIAALPERHPARAAFGEPLTVVPVSGPWPLRASRPWLVAAPAGPRQIESGDFWKTVAWAAAQRPADHGARIAAQRSLFAALKSLRTAGKPLQRRRMTRAAFDLEPVRNVRDWEHAVAPLAVAGTLAAAAVASALLVDAATRPEAWGAIARTPPAVDQVQ